MPLLFVCLCLTAAVVPSVCYCAVSSHPFDPPLPPSLSIIPLLWSKLYAEFGGQRVFPGCYHEKAKTKYDCDCGHGWTSVTTIRIEIDAAGVLQSNLQLYRQKCRRTRCSDKGGCEPIIRTHAMQDAVTALLAAAQGLPPPPRTLTHGRCRPHDSKRCEECDWGRNPSRHW